MAKSRTKKSSFGGRRGRNKSSWFKKLAVGGAITTIPALALGVGGYYANEYISREQIDASLCYPRADQYQAAIFVDSSMTHQASASQRRDLTNTLAQTFSNLPPNGKLSVFTTESGVASTINKPIFTLCKPAKTPAELAAIGAPSSAAPKLARQYAEAEDAFQDALANLMTNATDQSRRATSSPILEQIQGISRYNFGAPLSKFLVYTDGINNSEAGQFCAQQGHLPRFEVFTKRPDYRFIKPDDFGGADVDILLVEPTTLPNSSLPYCTIDELRTFWVEFFEGNGARRVNLTPLGHGAAE